MKSGTLLCLRKKIFTGDSSTGSLCCNTQLKASFCCSSLSNVQQYQRYSHDEKLISLGRFLEEILQCHLLQHFLNQMI